MSGRGVFHVRKDINDQGRVVWSHTRHGCRQLEVFATSFRRGHAAMRRKKIETQPCSSASPPPITTEELLEKLMRADSTYLPIELIVMCRATENSQLCHDGQDTAAESHRCKVSPSPRDCLLLLS
jgi:hypothetical protein